MTSANIDPVGFALMLGGLTLLPLVLMCTTCFLKVSIVLVVVRNAIGVQQVPPSIAVYAIALAVTLFVMAPVVREIESSLPTQSGSAWQGFRFSPSEVVVAAEPLRRFMLANTPVERREWFLAVARRQWPPEMGWGVSASDYMILVPSFVISELQLAFEIGFILYLPFVIVDLLMSNLLLALGMQMVSPMVVSLPLKMLLFVQLDGWGKLVDGLISSYVH